MFYLLMLIFCGTVIVYSLPNNTDTAKVGLDKNLVQKVDQIQSLLNTFLNTTQRLGITNAPVNAYKRGISVRRIQNPVKHLRLSVFKEIINGF